jgi:hypothetical protein
VWREGLWEKLADYGISGKMWRVLRSIYKCVESSVLLEDRCTRFFNLEVGLRQGCLLSPILFAIYINGLAEAINQAGLGIKISVRAREEISTLLFADDIVLIADDPDNLKKLMEITYQYSRRWRFSFNYDKSAIVIFCDNDVTEIKYGNCDDECSCGYHWKLGRKLIKQELTYKYLGVELDGRLTYKDFKKRVLSKARKNLSKMWHMGIASGHLSVKASINLFESLVRSVVEYGSEIIEDIKWEEGEKIQREIGRRILRCSGKTTNEVVMGELGWWRLSTRIEYNN